MSKPNKPKIMTDGYTEVNTEYEINEKYRRFKHRKVGLIDMIDEWITVKEFAERADISVQAVYKQLNKRLKPYLTVMNGTKMLNIKALKEVYEKTEDEPIKPKVDERLLNQLIAQLEEKDRQINELHRLLANTQMQLTESLHTVQMLEDRQKAEQQEEQKEQEVEPDPTEDEEIKPVSTESTEKNEKKAWWKRLFGI